MVIASIIINIEKMRKVFLVVAMLIGVSMNAQTPREITDAGLKELGIDNVSVFIKALSQEKLQQERRRGFVLEGSMSGGNGQYVMKLDMDLPTYKMIITIAHELIHLKQLENKELLVKDYQITYKRTHYKDARIIPHRLRDWEIDAFEGGAKLAYKIRKSL